MSYDKDALKRELIRDEGKRLWAYLDTGNRWTIGVGHLLTGDELMAYVQDNKPCRNLSEPECDRIFDADIADAEAKLSRIMPSWRSLDDVRQRAMLNLTFNLGNRLRAFVCFLDAMDEQDWSRADRELLDSKWNFQVGGRAGRIRHMIRTGEAL